METKLQRCHQMMKGLTSIFTSNPATKSPPPSSLSSSAADEAQDHHTRKHGGWKTMPYIIANETFERVASFGLTANLVVYLMTHYNASQVTAVNATNVWNATANLSPLLGAFLADAYLGRFVTLAIASLATLIGTLLVTLTAAVPSLHPPPHESPSWLQKGFLVLSLAMLTAGAGGVRPCSLPFGMDQFDRTTERGRRGTRSFFNWYYATNTAAILGGLTFVVYLQDSVGWTVGFAVPTALMFLATALFLAGAKVYVYVPVEGSVFSGILQVFVAAFRKWSLDLPPDESLLYNKHSPSPSPPPSSDVVRLPLTHQLRFLNKAAVVATGDLDPATGSLARPWRLSTVQRVEEAKCLVGVIPIWVSGIPCFLAISQQWTIAILQSLAMDRHLGPRFQIPPGSFGAISLIAIVAFLPVYDRALVPLLRRATGVEGGITVLQRLGVGIVLSALSMVMAGAVEGRRRSEANEGRRGEMSALWLVPQLVMVGVSEAFNAVGQVEFYNQEFPGQLKSLATALFFLGQAAAGFLSSAIVTAVHRNTRWLADDINVGRVDRFYYLLAFIGGVDLLYFIACARFYRYKGSGGADHRREEHHREQPVEPPATEMMVDVGRNKEVKD